jgi:serine/threonine protein kinase/tetratricopeptide (TPR) repeat protein
MRPELSHEEAIFDAAIEITDKTARAEYLDQACGGDETLRANVEELLACHDTAGDFLNTPLAEPSAPDPGLSPPTMIGPYRLIERIGEGGFGLVYRAEQCEPVRREVAIKIVRQGMASSQVMVRFEIERQSLALMRHPNIATVLDAGQTSAGWPYFVMELVDGRPIDQYCDHHRLDIESRLRLFVSVCRAVQHAHQKGIVHRDLKPSNVLVTLDDGRPVPKVIDFGIAKALRGAAPLTAELPDGTELRQLVGTPEYMSPEQVMSSGDVDTRADIYALGGMLYALFTGVAPPDTEAMKTAGFEAICRMIREETPVRPSQRLSSMGERADSVARYRGTSAKALRRTLHRDLDWIVMKALEKDRSRRYESASELARDIERYLDHEPVSAGPSNILYRASKLIRRNRAAVTAVLLVGLAVTLGGISAAVGFVRSERARNYANEQWARAEHERVTADQARERAAAEASKAQRVVALLEQMIGAANSEHGHRSDFTVRDLLDEFADSLDGQLEGQPEVEANIRRTIGRAYWSVGNMARAGPHLERALELRRQSLGGNDVLTAQSAVDYGLYLMRVSRLNEAEQLMRASLPTLEQAGPSEESAWACFVLSRVQHEFGESAASEWYAEQAWEKGRAAIGPEHPTTLLFLGYYALQRKGSEESEQLARDALARIEAVRPAEHVDVALMKRMVARIVAECGKHDDAIELAKSALETDRRLLGDESSHVVQDLLALAEILRAAEKTAEAEKMARDAVQLAERVMVERDVLRARANRVLATLLENRDPAGESEALAVAIETSRKFIPNNPQVASLLHRRGVALLQICRFREAIDCGREAAAFYDENPDETSARGEAHFLLAFALRQLGETGEALVQLQKAAEDVPTSEGLGFSVLIELIDLHAELGHIDEAERVLLDLDAMCQSSKLPIAGPTLLVGRGLLEMGKHDPAAADPILRSAITQMRGPGTLRPRLRTSLFLAQCEVSLQRFNETERVLLDLVRRTQTNRTFKLIDQYFVSRALARLYDAWDKPAEAARWRQRMAQMSAAEIRPIPE